MIQLFKGTKRFCYIAVAFGIIIPLVWLIITNFTNTFDLFDGLLVLLAAVLWIVIITLACIIVANKKMNQILNLMNEECKVRECVGILENMYQTNFSESESVKEVRVELLLNLVSGYLNCGEHEAAKRTLDRIGNADKFPNTQAGAFSRASYYNTAFMYYLRVNELAAAADMLDKMDTALEHPKISVANRAALYRLLCDKQIVLQMKNGNYDEAKETFEAAFERTGFRLGKVSARLTLGEIYLHEGQRNEAEKALKYVVKNGGDSYYAEQAKQLLAEMGSKG